MAAVMSQQPAIDPAVETDLWTGSPGHGAYAGKYLLAFILLPVFGIGLIYGIYCYLRLTSIRYVLTTQRIKVSTGIFSRDWEEIELYRVRDGSLREPFSLRMMGLGTVYIFSTDVSNPVAAFYAIKDARRVRELLRSAVEAVRRVRGIRALDLETT